MTLTLILGLILSMGSGVYLFLRTVRAEKALLDMRCASAEYASEVAKGYLLMTETYERQIANLRRELAEKRGRIDDIREPFWEAESEPNLSAPMRDARDAKVWGDD